MPAMSPPTQKPLPAPARQRFDGISQNRSLERGLEILRAFRPGTDLLGNGELAERTGLSAATVSRLTQTLVTSGFLEHDQRARAYRLAAPVLSLGHAMRAASPILRAATVARDGYCLAARQPGVIALSTPLALPASQPLVLNFSLSTDDSAAAVERQHAPALLALRDRIAHERESRYGAG